MTRMAILFAWLVSVGLGSVKANALLPEWSEADYLNVGQTLTASATVEGGLINVDLHTAPTNWTVNDIRLHNSPQCGVSNEVYVLGFQTAVTGTGHISITTPLVFDADLEVRSASASGEMLIRTSDLNPVGIAMNVSGRLWARLFGTWVDIGQLTVDSLFLEMCPFLPDLQWDLYVGRTWNESCTIFLTGQVIGDLVFLGIPVSFTMNLGSETEFAFSGGCTRREPINTCDTYRVELANTIGPGTMIHNYCSDSTILWYSLKRMLDFQFTTTDGLFIIEELAWNVSDGYHALQRTPTAFPPTETPLPEPTVTPKPPTATATPTLPPTLTPTAVPTGEATPVIKLLLNQTVYHAGDEFLLMAILGNDGPSVWADEYIVLEVLGLYYFWPDWGAGEEYYRSISMPTGYHDEQSILYFQWPNGAGALDGLVFHAALMEAGTFDFFCYDFVRFRFE